jgi:hypothetical protein
MMYLELRRLYSDPENKQDIETVQIENQPENKLDHLLPNDVYCLKNNAFYKTQGSSKFSLYRIEV